jgi:DNA polymerase-4
VTPTPRILLADCDQMFVAVARLVDPEGAGRAPLLVVGGRAESRGVVCSASYEVRAFGVRSGMPIARAVRLCPEAMYVPVPRQACGEKSREVAAALERWAPRVQAASIDEFYLDLTGTEAVYRNEPLAATAARIRRDVRATTGLGVSIGGGTNRLIAKLAAERAKPRPGTDGTGVCIVPPGEEAAFLATHQLAEIPGVGPKLQARLARYGLLSVRDALRVDQRTFEHWLGPGSGEWLFRRIRGEGGTEVDPHGEAKSMSREETFATDLTADADLERELLALCTRLASDVRTDGLKARCVGLKLRDFDFKTRLKSRTLDEAIDSDRALYLVARELLAALRARRRVPARLLGVALSRFEIAVAPAQLDLLPGEVAGWIETERDRAVARAVDTIARRFGRGAVQPARLTSRKPR